MSIFTLLQVRSYTAAKMQAIARGVVKNGGFIPTTTGLLLANRILGHEPIWYSESHCLAAPAQHQRSICNSRGAFDVFNNIGSNQFASGGITLMAIGAVAAMAKTLFDHVMEFAQRRLFVRADIDSRDDIYR